jgi:hypothetical protein
MSIVLMEILWSTYGATRVQHAFPKPVASSHHAHPRLPLDSAPGGRASSRALIIKEIPDAWAGADARPPDETR